MPNILSILKSDTKIIESIRKGDDSVLGLLYDKNIHMITKFIKDNNGTNYDSSELLQDALVVLWEKVRKNEFELKSKISTFLYAVVGEKFTKHILTCLAIL